MDFIQPIGPHDELDPIARVERLKDQQRERERLIRWVFGRERLSRQVLGR